MPTRRVLVTGSRDWTAVGRLYEKLDEQLRLAHTAGVELIIVHGDNQSGADRIAQRWVHTARLIFNGVDEEPHPANWREFHKAAGGIRNQGMVDLGADVCLAAPLPDSRGTYDCMRRARAAGIPVEEIVP